MRFVIPVVFYEVYKPKIVVTDATYYCTLYILYFSVIYTVHVDIV
jgi:hypothetical protein